MRLNRATSKLPYKPEDVETGVLYVGENDYKMDGLYRFWLIGKAKFGQRTLSEGFYTGVSNETLSVIKGSAVCFHRYPEPKKPGIQPHWVPDIIEEDNVQARIDSAVEHRISMIMQNDDGYSDIREALNQEEDDIELFESDFGLIDLDQEVNTDSSTAEPDVSASEQNNPRVGGPAEPGGESGVEFAHTDETV